MVIWKSRLMGDASPAHRFVLNVASIPPTNWRQSIGDLSNYPASSCRLWRGAGQPSQYPPGAISSPARHAQLELGHEIVGSARRHFEFPCDQSRRLDWPRDDELHQCGQARVRTPTDQSPIEPAAGEQPSVMLFHPQLRCLRKAIKKGHELRGRVLRTPTLPCDLPKTRVYAKKMRRGSRTSPEHCAYQEPAKAPWHEIAGVDLHFIVRLETSLPTVSISWGLRHFACLLRPFRIHNTQKNTGIWRSAK